MKTKMSVALPSRMAELQAARRGIPYENYSHVPVLTEPDQVKSLQTIIERRNNGVQPPIFNGSWANMPSEDINKMDFVAISELREQNAQMIEQLNADYHALTVKQNELLELAREQKRKEAEASARREDSTQTTVGRQSSNNNT